MVSLVGKQWVFHIYCILNMIGNTFILNTRLNGKDSPEMIFGSINYSNVG